MASFLELFNALAGNPADRRPLDTDLLDEGLRNLADIAAASVENDRRRGPPKSRVKIVGDPEIVDQHKNYFRYLGPALAVCLDVNGVVRTLEFVGVEGGKKDSNYIRDVWQFSVTTQKWKYRDLRSMQGTPAHRIVCRDEGAYYGRDWMSQGDGEFYVGSEDWVSEKGLDERPPRHFLAKFKPGSETFFINLNGGTFSRGPQYGCLKRVIENPHPFVEPLIKACVSPQEWMKKSADATRFTPDRSKQKWKPPMPTKEEQAVQVAQLVFGLTATIQHSTRQT